MAGVSKFEECTVYFCSEPHYSRGLCARHYQNWLRTGRYLPKQAHDLRYVMGVVDQFREITFDLLSGSSVYMVKMDGDLTILCRCRYCGEEATHKQHVRHTEGCPVSRAQDLLEDTVTYPPEDEFPYDL